MKYIFISLISFALNSAFAQGTNDTTHVRDLAKLIKEKRYWATYPDSMLHFANNGMKLATRIHDRYGIADMNKFIGIYYWSKGDYAASIDYYTRAKNGYDELGKKFESAQMLSNLGMVFTRLNDNEKALQYYQQAISIMENSPKPDIVSLASTISSMGLLFRNHNDLTSATEMFTRSLKLYEEIADSMNIAGTLTNLGTVYSRKQAYDSAALYNLKALGIFERLKNARGLVVSYNNLAGVAQSRKEYSKAMDFLNKAYSINKERGFFENQISTLIGMGEAKIAQGEFGKAEAYFLEGFEIAKTKNRSRVIEIYKGLSDSNRGLGNLKESLDYYDKFLLLKDSIYSQENAALISNLRISNELERKNASITLLEKDNKIARLSRNIIVIASTAILLLLGVLIYILNQKLRKDRKFMEQQSQLHEANQKIAQAELDHRKIREAELYQELEFRNRALTTYTLNLVQKNGMLDEVRGIIQGVIKEPVQKEAELKKLIRLIDYSFTLDKDWDGFKTYFEQVHPDFFKKLKTTFPLLSATELRLCALIRLALSIKESATVLSISPDSVKVSRHRLRKKLGLTTDDNLTEFIMAV
jgi:tetratricopeptide (TPR) repeat protein